MLLCVATLIRNLESATQAMTKRDATVGVSMDVPTKKAVTANLTTEDNATVIVKVTKDVRYAHMRLTVTNVYVAVLHTFV